MAKVKDLYIATCMEDLNKKCQFEFEKGKSIKSYLNMVNKTYQAAETAFKNNDEERAYILYMRYGDVVMKVRKTKDFQQQPDHWGTLFATSKLTAALERAEKLSKALKKRYTKLEESKNAKKAQESLKIEDAASTKEKSASVEQPFPKDKITSQELHQLLYKQQKQIIIMDIRSIADFQESHFIHQNCINVPKSAISPGSVPSKIEKGMPLDQIKIWNTRDSADLIVLMDWHSTFKRLQDKADPLRSLKDSIYKWEQTKELAREPVVLEGGYADWLESYPQFTSNPQVDPPDNKPKTSNINSLLDFDYADLRKTFTSPKPEEDLVGELENNDLSSGAAHDPLSNGEVESIHSTEKTKDLVVTPPAQSFGKNLPLASNGISSLYPKININAAAPKQPTTKYSGTDNAVTTLSAANIPSFDRSNKPKPVSATSTKKLPSAVPTSPKMSKSPNQSPLLSRKSSPVVQSVPAAEKKVLQNSPIVVDRSTKPKLPVEQKLDKPDDSFNLIANAKQAEISDLEQRVLKMKQEQLEAETRVIEIEEKKRLHLLSVEAEMKRKAEELAEREAKAKNELAATMRQDKPKLSQPSPKTTSAEKTESKAVSPAKSSPNTNQDSLRAKPSEDPTKSAVNKSPTLDQNTSEKDSTASNEVSPVKKVTPIVPPASKPQANAPPVSKPQASSQSAAKLAPHSLNAAQVSRKASGPPNIAPPTYASVKKTPTASSDTNISARSASKTTTKPTSNPTVYHEPLKDESETSSSFGLKRSFSSPNIAKMVQQEVDQPTPNLPSRQNKPAAPQQMIPPREAKPNLQDEQDPMVTRLNLSLRGVVGGNGEGAKCGLRNLGNSCYMNSVLQCMFNITQLADYFLTNSYKQDVKRKNVAGRGGKVAEIFAVLLRAIWSGQYRYLIPTDMKQIAGEIKEEFAGYTQEDSHEFLLVLLDALHEDLNKIVNFKYEVMPDNDNLSDQEAATVAWNFHKRRNESIIIELFSGQYKATVRCLSCGASSRKFDTFQFLTLSLPSRSCTLYELVKDFGKEEKLTGDNKWKCPKCKVLRNAVRTIEIWKLPPVLIIHLKRFVYSGVWRDKIHTNISFPMNGLNLTQFSCGPTKRSTYDLFAVSHHHGAGLDSGHYTASCLSVVDNHWYKFDDTEVIPSSPPQGTSAFILFYSSYRRTKPRFKTFS